MSLLKSEDFLADVERQADWYENRAGQVAIRYLDAVEATCRLIGRHSGLGPLCRFKHPRLREWRFFIVFRPFAKHILFYEVLGENVVMRRAMHGRRNLPRRLLEPPGTD